MIRNNIFEFTLSRRTLAFSSSGVSNVSSISTKLLPSLYNYGNYDLAISFLAPHNIVKDKVNAKKKIAWIHTDYSAINIDIDMELPVWNAFDHIISIAENVTHSFLVKFPSLNDKIVEIENILDVDFLIEQANILDVTNEYNIGISELKLLSIGRFSYAKNFESIPQIAKYLADRGLKFKWYIIGYGGNEKLIRDSIVKYGMQDTVIIFGKKENPYPYIKVCNFYIQPSRYEGKAVTVREAQILNKPVVITDFPTAASQLENGVDGIILPMENRLFANGLFDFIQNTDLQNKLIENIKKRDYGNAKEVEKLYNILDL